MMHRHAFPQATPCGVSALRSPTARLRRCMALHGFALLRDKQVGVAYGWHFLFALVQGEIVQHLQVSHGVAGSKGMTEGAADSMEPTLLPLPKKSRVIKSTRVGCRAWEQRR